MPVPPRLAAEHVAAQRIAVSTSLSNSWAALEKGSETETVTERKRLTARRMYVLRSQ